MAQNDKQGRLTYFKGEKEECERIFQRLFGKTPTAATLFRLAGAPASAVVTVGLDADGLLFDVIEPVRLGLTAQSRAVRNSEGGLTLILDDFRFLRGRQQRREIGTVLLSRQIKTARSLGFTKIIAEICPLSGENDLDSFRQLGFFFQPPSTASNESTELICKLTDKRGSEKSTAPSAKKSCLAKKNR